MEGINIDVNHAQEIFDYCCENGNLIMIASLLEIPNSNICVNKNRSYFNSEEIKYYGFRDACKNGHLNIIKYLLKIPNHNILISDECIE
jgi:ankyrin repeat protein